MNEIEKKQIEEMARDIEKYVVRDWSKELYIGSAEALYNAGYRNCKDKVVLSKEEWEVLHNDYARSLYNARQDERKHLQEELLKSSELKAETIKLAKQETAREFAEKLKRNFYDTMPKYTSEDTYEYFCKVNYMAQEIDELAKQYGVEVE